jgi:hypothetical protein
MLPFSSPSSPSADAEFVVFRIDNVPWDITPPAILAFLGCPPPLVPARLSSPPDTRSSSSPQNVACSVLRSEHRAARAPSLSHELSSPWPWPPSLAGAARRRARGWRCMHLGLGLLVRVAYARERSARIGLWRRQGPVGCSRRRRRQISATENAIGGAELLALQLAAYQGKATNGRLLFWQHHSRRPPARALFRHARPTPPPACVRAA